MSRTETLWLIPARGGSKGIPGKNVKPFCGRPLVCRAVDEAIECADPDDVIFVSTDSEEIKAAAESTGVSVPFLRPAEFATDTASSYSVIMHALDEFEKRGHKFERVVLLQPTSPLRTSADIRNALSLWRPEIDMVVSVCEARTNPYYNAFETDADGFLHISKGDGSITRRQDAPKVWEYNGAVYVYSTRALRNGPVSSFRKIIPSPMPFSRSVDLDTPEDWMMAETIYAKIHNLNATDFLSDADHNAGNCT